MIIIMWGFFGALSELQTATQAIRKTTVRFMLSLITVDVFADKNNRFNNTDESYAIYDTDVDDNKYETVVVILK